jgi:LacI family transcriptional regulator
MTLKAGRVNIKEVASAAAVSTQTVSRVINERPDVSPETRKRVQQVIEKLGYRPSSLARSLIRRRSYTLGVVTAGLEYSGPSRTLNGITRTAEAAGYSVLLKELSRFDTKTIVPIFQGLLSHHVDGIIWAVPEVGDNRDWVNELPLDLAIPVVYLTMAPREKISAVSINNYLGGRLATSHLLKQGYRHIGHIAGPLHWWEARQRMAGWQDTLLEAGWEPDDKQWVEGNWSSASSALALEKLLAQYSEMDSIFVANDQMALSVLQIAWQKGLSIPKDIGIVGFDNIPESAYFWPSLTTVQQDQYTVAKVAVEAVLRIIESGWQGEEPATPKSTMLAPTLIVRQSSLRH